MDSSPGLVLYCGTSSDSSPEVRSRRRREVQGGAETSKGRRLEPSSGDAGGKPSHVSPAVERTRVVEGPWVWIAGLPVAPRVNARRVVTQRSSWSHGDGRRGLLEAV